MRIVFMGTPDFACPSLAALVRAGHQVVLAVTQPDRPRGRGRKLSPPPLKVLAEELGVPVCQPEKIQGQDFAGYLAGYEPDVIVVVAYGRILPASILHLPPRGCINVHASLLPAYRGAAPIHRAIMNGESRTGVTTMLMNEGMDTGDILLQEEEPIGDEDNVAALHDRLAHKGARLLVRTLDELMAGTLQGIPQDNSQATYAPPLRRDDELIDWQRPVRDIYNRVRGLDPWPGACTTWAGRVLKIWRVSLPGAPLAPDSRRVKPGTVLAELDSGLLVQGGDGALLISELQLQGGKRLKWSEFSRGRSIPAGTVLGLPE
ncbi:MAG: methionyl-tRNA formyltransferase [Bacillota bacterium]|uniref:methionyl-tRNA formyltransferase n=1 Tax=Desulfurispora thermophila TaxID=265470 RepID=UPI00036AB7EF|nr:methionyl-tRNA formyltransferase [Desulfurispora thermophila]